MLTQVSKGMEQIYSSFRSSLQVAPFAVSSFTAPTGVIAAIYVFAILQIVGCYQIFCRPTFGFAYNHVIRYSTSI